MNYGQILQISLVNTPTDKWLSECAIEAIEILKAGLAELRAFKKACYMTTQQALDECRKWQLTDEEVRRIEE